MKSHRISEIGIEQLQPNWLDTEDARRGYASLYRGITQSIAGTAIALLVFGVGIGQLEWTDNPFITFDSPIRIILFAVLSAMFIGFQRGISQGEQSWISGEKETIKPVEVLSWSFGNAAKGMSKSKTVKFPTRYFIPVGIGFGVFAGVVFANTPIDFIFWVLTITVMAVVIPEGAALAQRRQNITTSAIEAGLSVSDREDKEFPNQGIRLSAKNALIVGIGATLAVGIPYGLVRGAFLIPIWGINEGMALGIIRGLRDGAIGGIIAAGSFGGITVIQHYTLRYMLWRRRLTPLHINRFFQEMAELGIMKSLGGKYSFTYPLLLEYFARQGWKSLMRRGSEGKIISTRMYVPEPKQSRNSRIKRRLR